MVKIRHYSKEGSTVITYDVVEEAEKVLEQCRQIGCFVYQESTKEVIYSDMPLLEEETYVVIQAIAGG